MAFTARLYRSLTGTYLALLVGPAVPVLLSVGGVAANRWLLFSLGALSAGGVGYALTTGREMVRWLTTQSVAVVVTVVPLGYLVWLIALFAHNPNKVLLTVIGRPSTAGVFAFGVALVGVVLANRQLTVERIQGSTVYASFTTGPAPRRRRIRYGSFAITLGMVAGLLAVLTISGAIPTALLLAGAVLGPLSLIALYSAHQRSFVVTDEGVAVDGSFTEWDDFESYALTDQSLILRRRSRWLGDLTLDATNLTALETVQTALESHLEDCRG